MFVRKIVSIVQSKQYYHVIVKLQRAWHSPSMWPSIFDTSGTIKIKVCSLVEDVGPISG